LLHINLSEKLDFFAAGTVPKIALVTGDYGASFGTTYETVRLRVIPRIRIHGRALARAVPVPRKWDTHGKEELDHCSDL
jgi:hypothetical protein